MTHARHRVRRQRKDVVFDVILYTICALLLIVILYPLWFIIIASFSDPSAVAGGHVWLWPVGFTLEGYQELLRQPQVWLGYRNTIAYTVVGTLIALAVNIPAAYALSRKDLWGRKGLMGLYVFTMFFSGGLIPSFINVRNLGLMNTVWAVLLPGAINATNMLIMRNYFIHSIPGELREAASIDGCSPLRTMTSIILPLSKSILIVVTLYYLVGHWNSYFDAMMYLRDSAKYPLQVILRQILLLSQMGDMAEQMGVNDLNTTLIYASLKYAIIVVSAVPLLVIYPMIQRFFEKGIMMGSVKG